MPESWNRQRTVEQMHPLLNADGSLHTQETGFKQQVALQHTS
jgi:hypothetical protein